MHAHLNCSVHNRIVVTSSLHSNNRCNTLRGAFDGTMFPKHIKKNEQFKVYRKAFCRTLPILFSHSGTQYGIDAYWFKLSDNAFDDSLDDPDTSCYCSKDKTCMRKGLGNITPCYYSKLKARLALSFASLTMSLLFRYPCSRFSPSLLQFRSSFGQ